MLHKGVQLHQGPFDGPGMVIFQQGPLEQGGHADGPASFGLSQQNVQERAEFFPSQGVPGLGPLLQEEVSKDDGLLGQGEVGNGLTRFVLELDALESDLVVQLDVVRHQRRRVDAVRGRRRLSDAGVAFSVDVEGQLRKVGRLVLGSPSESSGHGKVEASEAGGLERTLSLGMVKVGGNLVSHCYTVTR